MNFDLSGQFRSGKDSTVIIGKVKRRWNSWSRSFDRWMWLRRHGPAKASRGIFIFGAQRSGTTMLAGCFEKSPQFNVYGEMSVAFENSILKSLNVPRDLIETSARPFVVFKPLTDSHRAASLMAVNAASKAIWMYRRPADRANSAVAKFGDTNLRFLRELVDSGPTDRWEARGLSDNTLAILRRLDFANIDAQSAAGAFWFLRNQLFFDQQLENNSDVLLLKYETLVVTPEPTMKAVCAFIGCEYDAQMIKEIHANSVGRNAARLSPQISELCGRMLEKLDRCHASQWRSIDGGQCPHDESGGRN